MYMHRVTCCASVNSIIHSYLVTMLLEDSPQKKTLSYFREPVRKGELIQMNKSAQWIVAYSNPPIVVDCQERQVKVVDPPLVPYLLAVENLHSRYNLYINKLDFLKKCTLLSIGDNVDVMLKQNEVPSLAIVKYKGNVHRKNGIFFGLELLVSRIRM